jgi:hypothetical protein
VVLFLGLQELILDWFLFLMDWEEVISLHVEGLLSVEEEDHPAQAQ